MESDAIMFFVGIIVVIIIFYLSMFISGKDGDI